MINITLDVVLGSPSMKYPKNGFKIINITQIPKMNPARCFCFIVHCCDKRFAIYRVFGNEGYTESGSKLIKF